MHVDMDEEKKLRVDVGEEKESRVSNGEGNTIHLETGCRGTDDRLLSTLTGCSSQK